MGIYVPFDQREELSNSLATLSEAYIDGWESDSDSGDDRDSLRLVLINSSRDQHLLNIFPHTP